jgi:hypothetical protein
MRSRRVCHGVGCKVRTRSGIENAPAVVLRGADRRRAGNVGGAQAALQGNFLRRLISHKSTGAPGAHVLGVVGAHSGLARYLAPAF